MERVDPSDLYLLPPEDFTAARDAAAKQARADGDAVGAQALKALRRPSVAAHLVNLLADREPELLAQLLELGPALASAQVAGSGDALRELGAQRRQLVDAVTARAAELARREVSPAAREEVAATLEAALADLASADAVRSGRLVRALSYAGFGDVDLEGAVAAAPGPQEVRQPPDTAAAERAALEAAGALDDAVGACRAAEREREDADRAAAEADEEVARLRRQLSDAEQAAGAAHEEQDRRAAAAEEAVQAVRRAQQQEEQARTELDRLRRG